MDLKHLAYFTEVSRTGSFTHAAEKLYITQPALSRIIKSLEDEVGSPLFIRSRKEVKMTEAGQVLYKHAVEMERQYQHLQTELHHLHTVKSGHIRIGLPTMVNSFFFSQLIGAFHKEYPEVTFQLEEAGSRRIEEDVIQDKIDFGVVVLPAKYHRLDYFTFVAEQLSVVLPAGHALAGKESVTLQELQQEKFILFNQDFALRNLVLRACERAGFQPRVTSETSQLDFVEEMVASHLGVSLLPTSTCADLTEDVTSIQIVNPTIDWNLALIWKDESYQSQVNKKFIQFAREKLN